MIDAWTSKIMISFTLNTLILTLNCANFVHKATTNTVGWKTILNRTMENL